MPTVGRISDIPVFGSQQTLPSAPPNNKEVFLELLVAQMRHQDPLNPLEGTEFASQLAQFSQVEELQNINAKMEAQNESNQLLALSVNNTLATTLIGKQVRAISDSVGFDGTSDARIDFTLPELASRIEVEITNGAGAVVRTLSIPNGRAGDNSVEWDGRDGRGNVVPAGDYSIRISAKNGAGRDIFGTPLFTGRIDGVRFENGSPILLTAGRKISFGAVLEILESGGSSGGFWDRIIEETN